MCLAVRHSKKKRRQPQTARKRRISRKQHQKVTNLLYMYSPGIPILYEQHFTLIAEAIDPQ